MRIADHLSADIKKQLTAVSSQEKKEVRKPVKPIEKLTDKDLRELMATNRPVYKRVKGRIRQK